MLNFFQKSKENSRSSIDPVCGMHASNDITVTYEGNAYVFCSDYCKQEFEKDHKTYIR